MKKLLFGFIICIQFYSAYPQKVFMYGTDGEKVFFQKTDSSEVWSLKISSDGAYSLNFIFSKMSIPEGGELYIYNENGSMVYGPVIAKLNITNKKFMTDIIQGESVVLHLTLPLKTKETPVLVIQKVIHGYKDLFKSLKVGYGDSGAYFDDYDSDVVCHSAWDDESDGVVQILLAGGAELCSGSMLNNTAQDFKPYILTAFHCIDIGDPGIPHSPYRPPYTIDLDEYNGALEQYEIDEAENWMVRFKFRHATCGGSTFDNFRTYNSTNFRAAWHTTDFALVELEYNVINDFTSVGEKVWLGWDRSGNTPTNGTCIHHPSGDVAKISFENNSLTETAYGSSTGESYWRVANWDDGVTEGGSSGSPLFNQNSRIIGQLRGGSSACVASGSNGPNEPDWYGCFHDSWSRTGGNSTNQLSNWLQPSGSPTATTLNSLRQPTPQYSGGAAPLCSTTTFSVTNLAPGYTIHHWNRSDNISFPNGDTGTSLQVAPGTDGAAWVQPVINIGWGTFTMPRKNFWVGKPDIFRYNDDGTENYRGGAYSFPVSNAAQQIEVYSHMADALCSWEVYPEDIVWASSGNSISFYTSVKGNYLITAKNSNDCGESLMFFMVRVGGSGNFISFTPNPTTGETTLSIESTSKDEAFDEVAEWDLEIYSASQLLKEKKTSLRGQSTKIYTSGWKEGVYIVRVKYKGEILTEKLVVKK